MYFKKYYNKIKDNLIDLYKNYIKNPLEERKTLKKEIKNLKTKLKTIDIQIKTSGNLMEKEKQKILNNMPLKLRKIQEQILENISHYRDLERNYKYN